MEYQGLSKKALSVIRISAAFQGFLIFILGAGISLALYFGAGFGVAALAAIILFSILSVVYFFVFPRFRHMRYKYYIGSDKIEIVEGVVFVRRTIVPIGRIYQIDLARGPIDNAFGVAKVIITTGGSTATFRFLELEKAEEIAEHLNAVVGSRLKQSGGHGNV